MATIAKQKMGLASSTPDAIIHHQGLLSMKSFLQNSVEAQISEFFVRINSDDLHTRQTSLMRLRCAQQNLGITTSILQIDYTRERQPSYPSLRNNANYTVLIKAHKIGLDVTCNNIQMELWTVKNVHTPISELLARKNEYQVYSNLTLATKHHIFDLSQIMQAGTQRRLMSWTQVKHIHDIKSRGKPYKWFSKLWNIYESEGIEYDRIFNELHSQSGHDNIRSTPSSISPLTRDKRKKEWIVDFRNNEITFGKLLDKKGDSNWSYEHWREAGIRDELGLDILIKCRGCGVNAGNNGTSEVGDSCIGIMDRQWAADLGKVKKYGVKWRGQWVCYRH